MTVQKPVLANPPMAQPSELVEAASNDRPYLHTGLMAKDKVNKKVRDGALSPLEHDELLQNSKSSTQVEDWPMTPLDQTKWPEKYDSVIMRKKSKSWLNRLSLRPSTKNKADIEMDPASAAPSQREVPPDVPSASHESSLLSSGRSQTRMSWFKRKSRAPRSNPHVALPSTFRPVHRPTSVHVGSSCSGGSTK